MLIAVVPDVVSSSPSATIGSCRIKTGATKAKTAQGSSYIPGGVGVGFNAAAAVTAPYTPVRKGVCPDALRAGVSAPYVVINRVATVVPSAPFVIRAPHGFDLGRGALFDMVFFTGK